MADIHLEREHQLGFARAREIAFRWAEELEQQYGMDCTVHEGEDSDTVTFHRAGAKGTLEVTADRFQLHVTLGVLLGAFKADIERKVDSVLDALLAKEAASVKQTASVKAGASLKADASAKADAGASRARRR